MQKSYANRRSAIQPIIFYERYVRLQVSIRNYAAQLQNCNEYRGITADEKYIRNRAAQKYVPRCCLIIFRS